MDDYNDKIIEIPVTDVDVTDDIDRYDLLSESYAAMMSIWNNNSFRLATESLSNSLSRISDTIQSTIASRDFYETTLSYISDTASEVANTIKTITENYVFESTHTAIETMQTSLAGSTILAEIMQNAAVTSSQGIGSILQDAITPALYDIASHSHYCISDSLHKTLMESSIITDVVRICSSSAIQVLTPVLADYDVPPVVIAADALTRAMSSIALDFSEISENLLQTHDYINVFSKMFGSVRYAAELMTNHLSKYIFDEKIALHNLVHLLFRILNKIHERDRKRIQCFITSSPLEVVSTVVLINVKTEEPIKHIDYSARIRKLYLQKHQRISDESDDLDNTHSLLLAS